MPRYEVMNKVPLYSFMSWYLCSERRGERRDERWPDNDWLWPETGPEAVSSCTHPDPTSMPSSGWLMEPRLSNWWHHQNYRSTDLSFDITLKWNLLFVLSQRCLIGWQPPGRVEIGWCFESHLIWHQAAVSIIPVSGLHPVSECSHETRR